jgi:hypothetical protein
MSASRPTSTPFCIAVYGAYGSIVTLMTPGLRVSRAVAAAELPPAELTAAELEAAAGAVLAVPEVAALEEVTLAAGLEEDEAAGDEDLDEQPLSPAAVMHTTAVMPAALANRNRRLFICHTFRWARAWATRQRLT